MRGASDRRNTHATNSDVGGSQDDGGGHPPPSSSPRSPSPRPSTPQRSPSPPPRSPSPPPSTPPRSPSPRPSTPQQSPSPPPRSPPPRPSTPQRSPSPPPSTPPRFPSLSPSLSPPQSPVSVLPSASASSRDEISLQLWENSVEDSADCTEQKAKDNKEMIISLIAEVDEQNHVIIQKIRMLSDRYKYFRPIDRDGNCFYRAFIFSYLEHVLDIEDVFERISEVTHLRKCFEKAKQAYRNLISPWGPQTSFSPPNFYAFEHVFNLIEVGLSSEQLYWADMNDPFIFNTLRCLRSLTLIELCSQQEFYNPFLSSVEEYESVHEFCQFEVEPMETEANHWQIMALVNALGIPLVLENLDTSLSYGMVEVNQHVFCPRSETDELEKRTFADLSPAERRRTVTLLYRPGHYDILYLK